MCNELRSGTDIDRLLVCSGLSTPIFALIGNDYFGAVIQILGQKCRQKMVISSLVGCLGEIESDSRSVWTCICVIVPR